jgi:NTP pyrophosphatase (non-canonical NTP hydrolase)
MGDTAKGTWSSRDLERHIDEQKAQKLIDAVHYWRFQYYIHNDPREEDCDEACEQLRAAIEEFDGTTPASRPTSPGGASEPLTFESLRTANVKRCTESFHSIDYWAPWEWTNAMAGEVGEACNLAKKMARVWPSNKLIKKWDDKKLEELTAELALEIADVVIYADLLAERIGVSLAEVIARKFNLTSEKIGSEVRLLRPAPPAAGAEGEPDATV